jgi:hypothetical protein
MSLKYFLELNLKVNYKIFYIDPFFLVNTQKLKKIKKIFLYKYFMKNKRPKGTLECLSF